MTMSHPRRRTPPRAAGAALTLAAGLFVSVACEVAQVPPEPSRPNKIVMGYYRTSNKGRARPYRDRLRLSDPYRPRLRLARRVAGNLVVPAGFLYPELNAAARAAGVKMILSLGGWGNCAGFPGTDVDRRRTGPGSSGSSSTSAEANAYDGVDIDWEFVSNDAREGRTSPCSSRPWRGLQGPDRRRSS
ncbi:MAG: glycoside hydrolase family 18 protein [Candidatus Moduliflexus flocculans]|nr:glycoside hydrolase family 18 protein [Candidatus Moduliflexus flocculans]